MSQADREKQRTLSARELKIRDYPRDFPGRRTIANTLDKYEFLKENNICVGKYNNSIIKIAGRVISRRDMGKNIFFDLMDQTGTIQLLAKRADLENGITKGLLWKLINEADLGDCVGIEGTIGQNPRGEPLFIVSDWILLAKAIREPPDKHHGLNNPEMKYRHRELDLLSSADSRQLFKTRANVVQEIRNYLNDRDYIEIETPILQPIYGGATANPFITKHKSLRQEFYLSISSELYLKRALVGGFDRVYSISRCFRNEGISTEHNPEFTNVEIFATCETYETMARFVEHLLQHLWAKFGPENKPLNIDRRMGLLSADWPLSRKHSYKQFDFDEGVKETKYAQAWEMYIDDMEIASGASDLNDPREQESRLKGVWKDANEEGYNPYDQNYIEALEQGLLPVAGVGIGIDRLIMLLADKKNIRDVLMFPTLKDKN